MVRPSVGHTVQRSIASANESKFKSSIQLPGEETHNNDAKEEEQGRRTERGGLNQEEHPCCAIIQFHNHHPRPLVVLITKPTQAKKDQD